MDFRTKVDIRKDAAGICHEHSITLLGSCFSDNIGQKLVDAGFSACVNPLGTLYNPASIHDAICQSALPEEKRNGEFFSWLHSKAHGLIPEGENVLIITFGTAWIYRLKDSGMIVANCRKQPDRLFTRERLTVEDIVRMYSEPLFTERLSHDGKPTRILLTVSPIRHRKDGFHENQVSKSTLILAVEELCRLYPETYTYFPAYEIMMDELRDYRFYADDMLHPSQKAVDYIWERFQDIFFSDTTKLRVMEEEKETRRKNHIPLNRE